MPSSGSKRTGFSRRARFGVFAGYVVAVTGMIVGFGLILIAVFDPQGFASIRGAVSDVTAPISATGRGAVRGGGRIDDGISAWWRAGSQNRRLRAELEIARRRLIEAQATELENRRLRRMLRLIEREPAPVATARLVNSGLTGPRRFATLFAGRSQGVMPGQPVRAADGLVGRVIDTGRNASRVLLLTDSTNVVPVKLTRDGTPAFTTGRGDGRVDVRSLEAGRNPFRRGDVLVTSGTGGIYPPDIPVAVIVRVFGDTALGAPLANPAALDFAVVHPIYEPPEQEIVGPESAAEPGFSDEP